MNRPGFSSASPSDVDVSEWLRTLEQTVAQQNDRLDRGSQRMDLMQAELSANTAVSTEVRDILIAAKGAFRVLGGLGVLAKWIGALAGAGAAVWTFLYMATHGGTPPGK